MSDQNDLNHHNNVKELNIDLTSLYGFYRCLSQKKDAKNEWAADSYLNTTTLALDRYSNTRISLPISEKKDGPEKYIAPLFDKNLFEISKEESKAIRTEAKRRSIAWIEKSQNIEKIRKALEGYLKNRTFRNWIEWHIKNEWEERIKSRLDGVVERIYIQYVAEILNGLKDIGEVNNDDIEKMNEDARKAVKKDKYQTDFAELAYKDNKIKLANAADVLVRGSYYNYRAELDGRQHIYHTIRKKITYREDSKDEENSLGDVPDMLSTLLWIKARENAERKDNRLVSEWIDLVQATKEIYDLFEEPLTGKNAKERVKEVAKIAGLWPKIRGEKIIKEITAHAIVYVISKFVSDSDWIKNQAAYPASKWVTSETIDKYKQSSLRLNLLIRKGPGIVNFKRTSV